MNIMIVGAGFANKGAQSMAFVTIDEIKRRIPDAGIFFATRFPVLHKEKLAFDIVDVDYIKVNYASKTGLSRVIFSGIVLAKNLVKKCIGMQYTSMNELRKLTDIMPYIDVILDISGYALSSSMSFIINKNVLNNIRIAKMYDIQYYLMPQSFGPFNYSKGHDLNREIGEALKYVRTIYAREQDGYDLLKQKYDLHNVVRSLDIVLQNDGIDLKNIFKEPLPDIIVPAIREHSVAIIPNIHCFDGREDMLDIYKRIIHELRSHEFNIYIFRHSKEDLDICRQIKALFVSDNNVQILEEDFSCLQYSELISKFDFAVCSRYHGVVHSYRNHIPCLVLGWAVKYRELSEAVGQRQFEFDISSKEECDIDHIIEALDNLLYTYKEQAVVVASRVKEIQNQNCFQFLNELGENENRSST